MHNKNHKIYDCFTFFNELDLLELRLETMNDIVDHFVLVESTETFSNKPKELFYEKNKQLFEKFKDKIIHVIVDDFPEKPKDAWELEYFQRNAILRGILKSSDEDYIIISDVDEIPRPEVVKEYNGDFGILSQDLFYYKFNCKNVVEKWSRSVILKRKLLTTPQEARDAAANRSFISADYLDNAGWHFSYLGSDEMIKNKIESFSHQEFNTQKYKDSDEINRKIKEGKDLFDREDIKLEYVDIDDTFPEFILKNMKKYTKFIGIKTMSNKINEKIHSGETGIAWEYFQPSFEYEKVFNDAGWPWAGHKYFAYDFIGNLKPKKVVELGTHYGTSLWSFAQAAADLNLEVELNAVDTWEGENHAGFYGEEVFETVNAIKNKFYSNIKINLIRTTFEEALSKFEDNTIDVLHIDGLHTYDAVKHDFETWFPKIKDDGIVLFHDIVVNRDDFGVYRLWNELKNKYNVVEFRYSYGLGVLLKGTKKEIFDFKDSLELHYSYLLEDIENSMIRSMIEKDEINKKMIFQKEQEIELMKTSKFWKLREYNFKVKFLVFHPIEFIKKYI